MGWFGPRVSTRLMQKNIGFRLQCSNHDCIGAKLGFMIFFSNLLTHKCLFATHFKYSRVYTWWNFRKSIFGDNLWLECPTDLRSTFLSCIFRRLEPKYKISLLSAVCTCTHYILYCFQVDGTAPLAFWGEDSLTSGSTYGIFDGTVGDKAITGFLPGWHTITSTVSSKQNF